MTAFIFVAVFAALAGLTVPAASRRPRIGVPGAALFTAGAVALVPLVWVALFPLLAVLVSPVAVCGAVLLAANVRGAVRSRRRARERVEEWPDWHSQHEIAAENIAGGAR